MNYASIKYCDIANGDGVRTTLFVSGCTHHCKNCFQPETWSFSYGEELTDEVIDTIVESLADAFIDGLTLLGGEPMEPANQRGLLPLVRAVKETYPAKDIWCYTGDLYEDLIDPASSRHTEVTDELLGLIDVLVDGPFVEDLHDITLRFRGSSNQRVIDLAATRRGNGSLVPWSDDPAFASRAWVGSGAN